MKRTITFLFLSLCAVLSQAQITFLTTDIPVAGWVNAQQKDDSTGAVNYGSRGANQVYDFSRFRDRKLDSTFYLTPTSAQTSSVPGTTLAVTNDHSTYILARNAATLFDYVGGQTAFNGNNILTNFSPIDTGYKFPTAYGQNFKGTYGFQTVQPGSAVGQSSIYEVRLTNTTTYTDTIDGWGTVKTPIGTYNCLREHRIEHSSTLVEYKLFSFSSWSNVPTSSSFPSNPVVSTTNIYNYVTKETHGSAISFTYDSANNPLTASWSTAPPYPVANYGYTTGTAGAVAYTDSSTNGPLTYSWSFGDGSPVSTAQNPNHNFAANGTYYVCETVTNASGSSTKCDSVHISNIVVAAIPPDAGNDTASVVQPGTVTIDVLANDVNHNAGDSLCISSLIGPQAGWATIQGCNDIVFHALDSAYTGLDTFYYVVCDKHLTSLCDTATVVVTVRALPVPGFTVQSIGCSGHTFINHSTDADSVSWHISELGVATPYDTLVGNNNIVSIADNTIPFTGHVYLVCLTAANSAGTAERCDTVSFVCLGISDITPAGIRLYPNPAHEAINLDLASLDQELTGDLTTIQVYDMFGQMVKSISYAPMTSIHVGDLSNGVYMIGVIDSKNNRTILGKFEVLR